MSLLLAVTACYWWTDTRLNRSATSSETTSAAWKVDAGWHALPKTFLTAGRLIFAINLNAKTHLTITKCQFPGHHGRGVLAHSDATIERCTFINQSDGAVLLAPDTYWQEGPTIERVVVRDNHIENSNLLGQVPGAVWIGAFVSPDGRWGSSVSEVVNSGVAVTGNTFVIPNAPAVALRLRETKIEGNTITKSQHTALVLMSFPKFGSSGSGAPPRHTLP